MENSSVEVVDDLGIASCKSPGTSLKFGNPWVTRSGAARARVPLLALKTLWINTGTRCNIACQNCYIESSPKNDRLEFITALEVRQYLDEIERDRLPVELIGFTGGEPFMNKDLCSMLSDVLSRGHQALILTNGMRPMDRRKQELLTLKKNYGQRLTLRVSLDHYSQRIHNWKGASEAGRRPSTDWYG